MDLIEAASRWAAAGFKIVPLKLSINDKRKKELAPFWRWTSEPYPGFDKLNWSGANGFGVVLEATDKGWLAYVDADTDAPVSQDPFTTLTRAFPELQNTYIEKTPRGFHFFLFLDKPEGAVNIDLKQKYGLELHVSGLSIMAPSEYELGKYQVYSAGDIVKVSNFYELFKSKFTGPVEQKRHVQARGKSETQLRPCISAALANDKHIAHLMRLAIAAELKALGHRDQEIAERFRRQDDFDLQKTLYQVRTADPSKLATCQSIKEWGYCLGLKCPRYEENFEVSPTEILDFELETREHLKLHPLIDFHPEVGLSLGAVVQSKKRNLIFLAEKPILVSKNPFQIDEIKGPNISLERVKYPELSQNHMVLLFQQAREYFNNGKIDFPAKNEAFNFLSERLHFYWYHSQPEVYTLVVCWVLGTYFYPIFTFYPVLNPQGARKTGKTTLLDFVYYTAWNPTGREVALREADLFRTIQDSRVTYLSDITKLSAKSSRYWDLIDVVEAGSEREGTVRRIDKETGKPIIYRTFGPKAIATRQALPFTVKCIRIITEEPTDIKQFSKRRAEMPFDPNWRRAVDLCLRSAVKYWRDVYQAYVSLEQTDKLSGRYFNYWQPILAVCKVFHPEGYDALLKYAEEYTETEGEEDILSEVEKAILIYLSRFEEDAKRVLLKELTASISEILGEQVHHRTVTSALQNLKLISQTRNTSKGVSYLLKIGKAKELVKTKRLSIEENVSQETPSSNVTLEDIMNVFWSDQFYDKHVCAVCGYERLTSWQAETFKGEKVWLCEDCKEAWEKRQEEGET